MENEFEKYLQQNRKQFETGSPSPRVWEKLQRDLVERRARRHRVIRMRRIGWSIAACILLGVGITVVVLKTKTQETRNAITQNTTHRDSMLDQQKLMAQKMALDSTERLAGVTDDKTRQSLYRYTQLIDTRQKEMATLKQVDPELYARSQKSLTDLNEVYNNLKKQLPHSVDQQKILQSLLQNLKMQEQILTNQLLLIQGLQQQNQTKGDKNVKGI
ncbi:MAG: hypothetical protein ACXVJB_09030 [Mucilaginibacter sp.]